MNLFDTEIQSLSERFHLFSERNANYSDYIDASIREDELKYSISRSISKLLLHFPHFSNPSLEDFTAIIENYNTVNSTNLTANYFIDKAFIRLVSNEIIIPSVVRRTLWSIENKEKFKIPEEYSDAINCLTLLQNKLKNEGATILESEALSILDESEIDILIDKGILTKNKKILKWKGGEYPRHLRNEIASLLWMTLLKDEGIEKDKTRLLRLCNIVLQFDLHWPDHLDKHLSQDKLKLLKNEAYEFLMEEKDLVNDENEFQKSWLDSPQYSHKNMFDSIPKIKITGDSPHEIIYQIDDLDGCFQMGLAFGDSRNLFDLMLRFIIQYDHIGAFPDKYNKLKLLLNEINKPHLIYNIYWNVKQNFPSVIPYLLNDRKLVPITFLIIDQLDIKKDVVRDTDPEDDIKHHDHVFINQQAIKTELWFDTLKLFLRINQSSQQSIIESSWAIFHVLVYQIENFYSNPSNYPQRRSVHFEARKRFEFGCKQIQELRFSGIYHGIKPRIFPHLVKPLFEELTKRQSISKSEQRVLDKTAMEFSIQLLLLINTPSYKGEVSDEVIQINQSLKGDIIQFLSKNLLDFYLAQTVHVFDYQLGEIAEKPVRWGGYPFAYDILDWGYYYSYLVEYGFFTKLVHSFEKQIVFDKTSDGGIYEDQNNDIYNRLRLFLKALANAVIQIQKEKTKLEIWGLNSTNALEELYQLIESYSLKYCIDDLKNDRINILDDRYHFEDSNLYYVNLTTVVFKALSYRDDKLNSTFINNFIAENKNLAKLLNISNSLDSVSLKQLLSNQIQKISIDDFIKNSSTTHEWKEAMIDAINSPYHYELSMPIADRLEKHYEKVKHKNEQDEMLLFEVKLLHAFKSKNLKMIQAIDPPKKPYLLPKYNRPITDKKTFFIGLHWLYNERDFSKAIDLFEGLISNNPQNADYKYRIFHAKTLKAFQESNSNDLISAFNDWQNFISDANEETRKNLKGLDLQISLTSIYYYVNNEEYAEVDKLLDKLPPELKFDEEINQLIYDMFNKRGLNSEANSYAKNAIAFRKEIDQTIPDILNNLYESIDFSEDLDKLKQSFKDIYQLPPEHIIHTIPMNINQHRNLNDFILNELIKAGKILMEKIKSISDIKWENKYNDLLQSILRMRFSVWNWTMPDQGRVGESNTGGDDLGSSDFSLESGGEKIALIEGMILKGRNKSTVEKHITKCDNYLKHTSLFYIVTYFKGKNNRFKPTWENYKKDVMNINYVDGFKLVENQFEDHTVSIKNSRNILVGLTRHEDDIRMYHIFFNIGAKEK